jgi:hypothetical protein
VANNYDLVLPKGRPGGFAAIRPRSGGNSPVCTGGKAHGLCEPTSFVEVDQPGRLTTVCSSVLTLPAPST